MVYTHTYNALRVPTCAIWCSDVIVRFWYSSQKHQTTFRNYIIAISHTLCLNLTYLCHIMMLNGLFTECDAWLLVTSESWRVPLVGQEMLTLSGTLDFTPFGEFMISPIHGIYTLPNLSVLGLCLWLINVYDWLMTLLCVSGWDWLHCLGLILLFCFIRIKHI